MCERCEWHRFLPRQRFFPPALPPFLALVLVAALCGSRAAAVAAAASLCWWLAGAVQRCAGGSRGQSSVVLVAAWFFLPPLRGCVFRPRCVVTFCRCLRFSPSAYLIVVFSFLPRVFHWLLCSAWFLVASSFPLPCGVFVVCGSFVSVVCASPSARLLVASPSARLLVYICKVEFTNV